jgi:hypothetical protein
MSESSRGSQKFWGFTSTFVVSATGIPLLAGLGKGISNVLNNEGSFIDGLQEGTTKVVDASWNFGCDNAEALTNATISAAGRVAGQVVGEEIKNHHNKN